MAETIDRPGPEAVLDFWFVETPPRLWWAKSEEFDRRVEARFGATLAAAAAGELFAWRESPQGRLAEIIVLDQFSRNIFRDRPQAFAQDGMALALAQTAVALGADRALEPTRRAFLYLPYMHSESLVVHAQAMALFAQPGLEGNLEFERKHKAIIERFGRYPHRNKALGRASTAEEIEFLMEPGSGF
ncbi:MAG: DUF924 domain-containing protein [Rhodospirillales bacterium]|nr:DUF924 domain-containing protein [Rhodospirillales bacterium]